MSENQTKVVISPRRARYFANLLLKHAADPEAEASSTTWTSICRPVS
ncbi:MAG: hypothetical protein ABR905_22225 [Terracidiphilus sp.]|jgi:hypothetical protein